MTLSDRDLRFLTDNHSAAMITVGDDGAPKAVRVGVVLVDGKLWSSGTRDRIRTRRLRDRPACTLFVFDAAGYAWLTLETTVTVLDGVKVPEQSVRLFRVMQSKPEGSLSWFGGELGESEFLQTMVDEGRVIYEFAVDRVYGMA
jgi:uncharacterized pyridoxamine 5'-phosphate oxidase family protein